MPTLKERVEGGVVGLLIGDALGVPYEFHPAADLPLVQDLEYEPPDWFLRSHAGVRPGTWSDDGAQALCLLESLLHHGSLDPDDFGRRLVNWYEWGHLAVGGRVFDVGGTTATALRAIQAGTPTLEAAPRDAFSNGNGSLMRVLPLALWHQGTDADLVRDARLSSQVTHGHLRSQLCCALYCLWVRGLLAGGSDAWNPAVTTLREIIADDEACVAELEFHIRPDLEPEGHGSGYVVDTLRSARMVLQQGTDYEAVVKGAIALGNDTDTTAAVAGGVAGVVHGVRAIPQRLVDGLRGKELLEPLLSRLLARF